MYYIRILFFLLLLKAGALFSQTADTAFALCGEKYSNSYFVGGLKYKGDFYAIKKHFFTNFPANGIKKVPDNSGIVRIKFFVNCKGIAGNYTYETYSLDYKTQAVNDSIVQELLKLTKELKDWKVTENHFGTINNIRKFFAFKIVNGELTDILPK